MPTPQQLPAHLVAELTARASWKKRDYSAAFDQAGTAGELALEAGDDLAWWNMLYLQGECLRDQGLIQECLPIATTLTEHPLTPSAPDLGARAYTLLAVALQGLGRLPEAARAAATAGARVAGNPNFVYLHIQAQQALIAALAEGRLVEEAWQECLVLESLLTQYIDDDIAGKAYWVIGNVAFLSNRVTEGSTFHDVAAERLSPSKDVDLWARFNRASAEMRLQAGLGDAATLRCIERAELATDIVDANDRERLEMALVRAHWHYLTGDTTAAVEILQPLCARAAILATQTAAEAHFLLGRALDSEDRTAESRRHLEEAARLFDKAAASERSANVREYLGQSAYGHNL